MARNLLLRGLNGWDFGAFDQHSQGFSSIVFWGEHPNITTRSNLPNGVNCNARFCIRTSNSARVPLETAGAAGRSLYDQYFRVSESSVLETVPRTFAQSDALVPDHVLFMSNHQYSFPINRAGVARTNSTFYLSVRAFAVLARMPIILLSAIAVPSETGHHQHAQRPGQEGAWSS